MQKVKEISLPHYQSVSSSNEYAPICNRKMTNIDLNEFWHSLPAKNKNFEIQMSTLQKNMQQYQIPLPCPRTKFMQAKKWQLMHNKTC